MIRNRIGRRIRWYALGSVAMVAAGVVALTATSAYSVQRPEWTVTPIPGVGVPSVIQGVDGISVRDVWAVGSAGNEAVAAHWNGRRWQRVETPAGFGLTDVDAMSSQDSWAVGIDQNNRAHTIHWDGKRWSDAGSPVPPGERHSEMEAVVARSADDVWVAGTYFNGRVPFAAHWDGRDWAYHEIPLPVGSQRLLVQDVAVTERDEVLVSGAALRPEPDTGFLVAEPSLIRFDGTQWVDVALPDLGSPSGYITALLSGGRAGTWLAGHVFHDQVPRPVLLNWQDGQWSTVQTPAVAASIEGLARGAGGGLLLMGSYAVGLDGEEAEPVNAMALLRYDGTAVTVQQPPGSVGRLFDAVAVPYSATTWIVGMTGSSREDMSALAGYSS